MSTCREVLHIFPVFSPKYHSNQTTRFKEKSEHKQDKLSTGLAINIQGNPG